jgi:hypothetical protein
MCLFCSVQSGLNLETYLKDKCASLDKKRMKFQPHVICVCDDLYRLTQRDAAIFYVVLDSQVYFEVSSLFEAVEICVKACFVFNICFLQAARSSWLFMQQAVYGIHMAFDGKCTRVSELMTDTGT